MKYEVRPKILRLATERANDQPGVRTLNGYSTAYCLSRTLEDVLLQLSASLKAGRESRDELLRTRDGCILTAGILLAAAEQAQRDYDSARDAQSARNQTGVES
jgi:hypothetical protein